MLFSIIIPTYNNSVFLKRAIESIENQTSSNYELIIIDNNSTDDTDQLVKKSSCKNITYEKINNQGIISKSRNLGIKIAKGDWLIFLDSDDTIYKNKIKFLTEKLTDDLDLVCNGERLIYVDSKHYKTWKWGPLERNFYSKMLVDGNKFSTSASAVKRIFLKKNNIEFCEKKEFVTAEDYDFFMNIVNAGAKVKFYEEILGDHYVYKGSLSSNYQLHKNSVKEVLKHHIYNVQNFSQDKNKLWKELQWRFSIMDFIKEFKEMNYLKSLKFLIHSFINSPLKVSFFLIKNLKKRLLRIID